MVLFLYFDFFKGLMYVIETQKVLDLKVNLMASYIIVPQTGFYSASQNILLLDLGHFEVRMADTAEHYITTCHRLVNYCCFPEKTLL